METTRNTLKVQETTFKLTFLLLFFFRTDTITILIEGRWEGNAEV